MSDDDDKWTRLIASYTDRMTKRPHLVRVLCFDCGEEPKIPAPDTRLVFDMLNDRLEMFAECPECSAEIRAKLNSMPDLALTLLDIGGNLEVVV